MGSSRNNSAKTAPNFYTIGLGLGCLSMGSDDEKIGLKVVKEEIRLQERYAR